MIMHYMTMIILYNNLGEKFCRITGTFAFLANFEFVYHDKYYQINWDEDDLDPINRNIRYGGVFSHLFKSRLYIDGNKKNCNEKVSIEKFGKQIKINIVINQSKHKKEITQIVKQQKKKIIKIQHKMTKRACTSRMAMETKKQKQKRMRQVMVKIKTKRKNKETMDKQLKEYFNFTYFRN